MLAATAVRCLGLLPPARENTEGGRNGQTLTATLRGRLGRVVFRTGSKCSACAGSLQASSLGRKAHRPRRPRRAAADVSPFPPPLVASPAGGSSPRHRTRPWHGARALALTWSVPRADRPCLGCSSRPQRPPKAAGTARHRLQHAVDAVWAVSMSSKRRGCGGGGACCGASADGGCIACSAERAATRARLFTRAWSAPVSVVEWMAPRFHIARIRDSASTRSSSAEPGFCGGSKLGAVGRSTDRVVAAGLGVGGAGGQISAVGGVGGMGGVKGKEQSVSAQAAFSARSPLRTLVRSRAAGQRRRGLGRRWKQRRRRW